MGNSNSYDNSNRSDIFKVDRYISVKPEIRIGLLHKNDSDDMIQALQYNDVHKPYKLLNVYKEFHTEFNPCPEGIPNPNPTIKTLRYDFEDGFKLCFKKYKNASVKEPPIIILENSKKNIFINMSMCPTLYKVYKPLGQGRLSEQLDLIYNFFRLE